MRESGAGNIGDKQQTTEEQREGSGPSAGAKKRRGRFWGEGLPNSARPALGYAKGVT